MKIPVNSIIIRDRVRKDIGDITSLMKSMKDHGQLNPIALTRDNELIAGHRRLLAAQRLSWQYIDAHIVERDSAAEKLELELEENVHRKDFSPEELLDGFRRLEKLRQPPLSGRIGRFLRNLFRKLFRRKQRAEYDEATTPDASVPDEALPTNPSYAHAPNDPDSQKNGSDADPYGI